MRRAASGVQLEIADTGEGIDPEVLPFVFDRFRQENSSSTRTHMGLGLGLAIVKHMELELHGGEIGVRSDGKGKGATFRLTLPAATEQQVEASRQADEQGGAASNDEFQRMLPGVRVFRRRRRSRNAELLTALLEARGILVRAAGSVREGLAAIEREIPDIILSDLAMPDEDGYDLIRSVRGRPAESGGLVPAIAVTAYVRREGAMESLSSGFQAHLSKPIDPVQLFSALERLTPERLRRPE